jgi:glycopeptide antibiotics resistance protein
MLEKKRIKKILILNKMNNTILILNNTILILEMLQLLLTHGVEDIARVVIHCNKKVVIQVVM